MPESGEDLKPGSRYQIEVNGVVVEEFTAQAAHNLTIEGTGSADVSVGKLPAMQEPVVDTYTSRPPAPKAIYRSAAGGTARWATMADLLDHGEAGVYFGAFAQLDASIRIELDMETRS